MAVTPARIQVKRDTAAAWSSVNPVLLAGEYGRETDTGRTKVGDGVTAWNALPYDGIVTVTDKAKLDAATALPSASTLVLRDGSGRAQVASPVAAADIATRAFVESAVAGGGTSAKAIPEFDLEGRVDGNLLIFDLQEGGSERWLNNTTVIQRWTASSAAVAISQQDAQYVTGGSGLAMVFTGPASVSTNEIVLSPVPASLTFSAYLARLATSTLQVRFEIAWRTSSGAAISTSTGTAFSPATVLTPYAITATAPANAARAVFSLTLTSGTGTVHADRIVVRPVAAPPYKPQSRATVPYRLVFEDAFSGALDVGAWTRGTPAAEFTRYGIEAWDENLVSVAGGSMTIRAEYRAPNWFSGMVTSRAKRSWRFGYFEARLRWTTAPGLWPFLSMMPEGDPYGLWARSGGINIIEHSAADPSRIWGSVNSVDIVDPNYATNTFAATTAVNRTSSVATGATWSGVTWHTYGVLWDRLQDGRILIQHYVDGKPYGTHMTGDWTAPYGGGGGAPYDGYFYLVAGLAVGGTWPGAPNATTTNNATMEIDYMQAWQR